MSKEQEINDLVIYEGRLLWFVMFWALIATANVCMNLCLGNLSGIAVGLIPPALIGLTFYIVLRGGK